MLCRYKLKIVDKPDAAVVVPDSPSAKVIQVTPQQ